MFVPLRPVASNVNVALAVAFTELYQLLPKLLKVFTQGQLDKPGVDGGGRDRNSSDFTLKEVEAVIPDTFPVAVIV